MRPVVIIAAVGRNGAIGLRDRLPWRLPSDLRRFRTLTMGKPVVMGRKTFASLGRPLPGRHLVVVSRDAVLRLPDGIDRAATIAEALARAQDLAALHHAEEIMVAGGAEIYRSTIDEAERLAITEVDLAPEADSTFPTIDRAVWREVGRAPQMPTAADEAGFAYVDYRRRDAVSEGRSAF